MTVRERPAAQVHGQPDRDRRINSIFAKLGLYPGDTGNRRVLAVLRYLGTGPGAPAS